MTTPILIPTVPVPGIPATPLPFGLRSVAVEQVRTDKHTRLGVELETDLGYSGVDAQGINCSAGPTPMVPEEIPSQWPTVITKPFLVYAGVKGKLVGRDAVELQNRAKARLNRGIERVMERVLWSNSIDVRPLMGTDTQVLGGGTATDPDAALGLLEQWIADNIGQVGVIHTSRYGVSVMGKNATEKGAVLKTKLGTPIAFGGGYRNTDKTGTAAGGTNVWVVATGPVLINRSAQNATPEDPEDGLNTTTNDATMFASEVVSIGYEGGAAAVLVSVEN